MTIEAIRKLIAHRDFNTGKGYDTFSREVVEELLGEIERLRKALEDADARIDGLQGDLMDER